MPQLPPLQAAVWHAHQADGQPLPALVAHGTDGGRYRQDFLDSAQVHVRADGTWDRRLWMSRVLDQANSAPVAVIEHGASAVTDTAHLFTVVPSGERFVLRALEPGTTAAFPLRGAAGYIAGAVRTVRPAPSVMGTCDIREVNGQAIPAPIHVFEEVLDEGREVSIHLVVDSARLVLLSNGTYQHAILYTGWEGPRGGPPTVVRFRRVSRDFGSFTRTGDAVAFESAGLQDHRFAGVRGPDGVWCSTD